jgi:hypothetical protein
MNKDFKKDFPKPPPAYSGPDISTVDFNSSESIGKWYAASHQRYTEGDKRKYFVKPPPAYSGPDISTVDFNSSESIGKWYASYYRSFK